MDIQLSQAIDNAEQWAAESVSNEWQLFEIPKRDGYFVAVEAAKTRRLLAMTLARVDRLDKKQDQVVLLLKIIAGCLILIAIVLAASV